MSKKPTRKITLRVSPQTAYNLELLKVGGPRH